MSNTQNTQTYSKETIRIRIRDMQDNPIVNAKVILLAMGLKTGQKIPLDGTTDSNGEILFDSKPYLKDINRFEITIEHKDYYTYPKNRVRKLCRSYEYGHLCEESFEKIPSFSYNGTTLCVSKTHFTPKYALYSQSNQAHNHTQEYYIQLQENSTSLKIYTDENLTKESNYTLSLDTQTIESKQAKQTPYRETQETKQPQITQQTQHTQSKHINHLESTQTQSNDTILSFDSKDSLRQFTNDIQEIIAKDKKKGHTSLVHRFVVGEEKIQIFNQNGIYLFSIERKGIAETKLAVRQLYDKKIQWFESSADNYHKLVDVNPDLRDKKRCQELGVLYFDWKDIVKFAEVDRMSISYQSDGSGDWKKSPKGAKGFILVSMEGIPYWADAVGQIPYAIGVYRNLLSGISTSIDEAREKVIYYGYCFHDGNAIDGMLRASGLSEIPKEATINDYDNTMILRGVNFAQRKYTRNKKAYPTHYEWEIIDLKPNPSLLALDSSGKEVYGY